MAPLVCGEREGPPYPPLLLTTKAITTMNISGASAPTTATQGRERSCDHCGATYRAIRSTSQFCSDACRQAKARGVNPRADEILLKRLQHLGFVGHVGPYRPKAGQPPVYALTVPSAYALAEINARYNRPTAIPKHTASLTLAAALATKPATAPDMCLGAFFSALDRLNIKPF